VQRYVTDWAGTDALVRQVAIRLGVPCYAGDTLTFSGQVIQAGGGERSQECVVEVVGRRARRPRDRDGAYLPGGGAP
jgi:hypothetical protein